MKLYLVGKTELYLEGLFHCRHAVPHRPSSWFAVALEAATARQQAAAATFLQTQQSITHPLESSQSIGNISAIIEVSDTVSCSEIRCSVRNNHLFITIQRRIMIAMTMTSRFPVQ